MEVNMEVKKLNDDLVDRLVAYRKALHITQQDIADSSGIKRPNIARIECKKTITTLESFQRYAKCLGLELKIELVECENKE